MTKVEDYESVSIEEKLEMPIRSHGIVDVMFCTERKYYNRFACLLKCGVLRVIELPF